MLIKIGHELVFQVPQQAAMQLMLHSTRRRPRGSGKPERIGVEVATVEDFTDWFGNRLRALWRPPAPCASATTTR